MLSVTHLVWIIFFPLGNSTSWPQLASESCGLCDAHDSLGKGLWNRRRGPNVIWHVNGPDDRSWRLYLCRDNERSDNCLSFVSSARKAKATSKSLLLFSEKNRGSGYCWNKTFSASPDVCARLSDPIETMGQHMKKGLALGCFILTYLLP